MSAGAALLLGILPLTAGAPPPTIAMHGQDAQMDEHIFWELIARTRRERQADQEAALRAALEALPTERIAAFQARFDALMAESYRWDLWGAAFVIHGGASDDGFDYFRCWLIGQGEETYRAALAAPDSLAEHIPADAAGAAEFEGLGYVALDLWSRRTGRPASELPVAVQQPSEPIGEAWAEDAETLAHRYPRLWARFGDAPLE